MKIITTIMMLCLALPIYASERIEKFAVLTSFAVIDYKQSCDMFYEQEGYYELNPILGRQPTRSHMLIFGISSIAMLWLTAQVLPEEWGDILLNSAISSEQFNIEDNVLAFDGKQRRIDAIPIILTFRF